MVFGSGNEVDQLPKFGLEGDLDTISACNYSAGTNPPTSWNSSSNPT